MADTTQDNSIRNPGQASRRRIPGLGWFRELRYGRSVSIDFFRRNAWLLISILVALLALMGLRYKTKTKMQQIKTLERELVRAESAKLQEKAEYMSLIRESEMQRLSDQRNLGLTFQEQPPYTLTYEKD